jgi:hypothetical protein
VLDLITNFACDLIIARGFKVSRDFILSFAFSKFFSFSVRLEVTAAIDDSVFVDILIASVLVGGEKVNKESCKSASSAIQRIILRSTI